MNNYFENVDCVEELKKQFLAKCKELHPDNGGNEEAFKAMSNEYEVLFKKYKNIHRNVQENATKTTYTSSKETLEKAGEFMNIVIQLMGLKGIEIELCGRWLWISGDTKAHKDILKSMGCKWANNKKMWSWHFPEDTTRRTRKTKDMNYIRNMYGSMKFEEQLQLA